MTDHRTEADGANLLARAVAPHGGIVMWRAFVYGNADFGAEELVKQSYSTFAPLDGAFDDNVVLQIKNGPMDFQIREPLHPLLGALKKVPDDARRSRRGHQACARANRGPRGGSADERDDGGAGRAGVHGPADPRAMLSF